MSVSSVAGRSTRARPARLRYPTHSLTKDIVGYVKDIVGQSDLNNDIFPQLFRECVGYFGECVGYLGKVTGKVYPYEARPRHLELRGLL